MLTLPHLPPRTPRVRKMAKVCMVNGTAAGMDIQEQIAMRAAKRATRDRLRADIGNLLTIVNFRYIIVYNCKFVNQNIKLVYNKTRIAIYGIMRGKILIIQKSVAASNRHTRCTRSRACVVTTQARVWCNMEYLFGADLRKHPAVFNKTALPF